MNSLPTLTDTKLSEVKGATCCWKRQRGSRPRSGAWLCALGSPPTSSEPRGPLLYDGHRRRPPHSAAVWLSVQSAVCPPCLQVEQEHPRLGQVCARRSQGASVNLFGGVLAVWTSLGKKILLGGWG